MGERENSCAISGNIDSTNSTKKMSALRIGFIGAGQMATALGAGFVRAGLVAPADVHAADPDQKAREKFAKAAFGNVGSDNVAVAEKSRVLFLAVKPQQLSGVSGGLKGKIPSDALVVSIAAGVRLAQLALWLGEDVRLIRVMPNTPCLVGQGACAFSLGGKATEADAELVEKLLRAVGAAWQVEEKLLDAVTGLSGSGPAFAYVMIEALGDAGVRMGLPRAVASALAAQTVRGAAEMVVTTGEHPAVLKDRVASPGGTTIAGLQALENGRFRGTLIAAVEAATKRSIELADEAEKGKKT
jgi:pyrroline-5-carboxylate reductase